MSVFRCCNCETYLTEDDLDELEGSDIVSEFNYLNDKVKNSCSAVKSIIKCIIVTFEHDQDLYDVPEWAKDPAMKEGRYSITYLSDGSVAITPDEGDAAVLMIKEEGGLGVLPVRAISNTNVLGKWMSYWYGKKREEA